MHSTRAETESSYVVNVTSSQAEPLALKVGSMCLTVHGLFHLPAKLTELNSEHDILEIIFKPTAKYYYDDQRVTVMELPEHRISASPSSIVCVNNGIRNSNSNNSYALEFDKRENNLFCSLDEGRKIEEINTSTEMDSEMNAMSINESLQNMHSNNSSDVTINTGGTKNSSSSNKRLPPLSGKTNTSIAPHHALQPETHIDCDNESDYNSPTLFTSTTAPTIKSSPSSKVVKSKYEELRKEISSEESIETEGCSSFSTTNVVRNGIQEIFASDSGNNNNNNNNEEILERQKREWHKQRQLYLKSHQFTVYFPSRADLKVIIEIFVAVRHRRKDSCAMRWLTTPIESLNFSSGLNSVNAGGSINGNGSSATSSSNRNSDIPSFAVAHGEVMHYKSVNRLVGLSIGHLLCSMSLPHVYEDLSSSSNSSSCLLNNEIEKKGKKVTTTLELPHVLQTRCNSELMNAVVKRLIQNEQEHIRFRSFLPSVESTLSRLYLSEEELHWRLSHGQSEWSLTREITLFYNSNYYVERVQSLLDMYPLSESVETWINALLNINTSSSNISSSSSSDKNNLARDLVCSCVGVEEELIRTLCVELGPEYCAISPRMRRMVYRWYYRLNDEEIKQCTCARFGNVDNLLDYHPNYFMRSLVEKIGPELTPTRYNFPTIHYAMEQRTMFASVLRFPVNKPDGHFRDNALAGRRNRIPLQVTPNERPLKPLDRHQHYHDNNSGSSYSSHGASKVSEIDILLEKYQPEFHQIIPSIADAMEMMVNQNEALANSGSFVPFNCPTESQREDNSNTTNEASNEYNVNSAASFALFRSANPSFSYTTILTRLANYTYISPSSLLAAVIYLDRLALKCPALLINRRNVEKLLVTSVRIASKVVDLRSVNNKNFANVFSLSTQELNKMEEQLLKVMWFDFFLSPEEFRLYTLLLEPQLVINSPSITLGITPGIMTMSGNGGSISISSGGGGGGMNALNNNYNVGNSKENSGDNTISSSSNNNNNSRNDAMAESNTEESENQVNKEIYVIHSQEEQSRKSKSVSESSRSNVKSGSPNISSSSRVKNVRKDLSVSKNQHFTSASQSVQRQSPGLHKANNEETKNISINKTHHHSIHHTSSDDINDSSAVTYVNV